MTQNVDQMKAKKELIKTINFLFQQPNLPEKTREEAVEALHKVKELLAKSL